MNSNENLKRLGSNPGAVVNIDNPGLKAYREARERVRQRNKDFEQMKTEITELKSMMSQILEKLDR
jgi:hypothetical protein